MQEKTSLKRSLFAAIASFCLVLLVLGGCTAVPEQNTPEASSASTPTATQTHSGSEIGAAVDLSEVPDYSGADYIVLNDGEPAFTEEERQLADGTEHYGTLDEYGRATSAFAKLCGNTCPAPGSKRAKNMPDPSGFVQASFPEIGLDHLYERSHLIAYSLSDEAVNPCDLITGTNHLNQEVMGDFEDDIRAYLSADPDHDRHVLMRVTPDFRGDELVARGVQIEALSLEDDGAAICFNVYCYNIQPGIVIDYATGASALAEARLPESSSVSQEAERTYVLNTNTKRFHYPDCKSATDMKPKNRKDVTASREELLAQDYVPCGRCNP